MNDFVHASMPQYAVISVGTQPRCERLVIAYSDEKSLRDLIAAPCILALGYRRRQEAVAGMDGCIPTGHTSMQQLRGVSAKTTAHSLEEFVTSKPRAKDCLDSSTTRKIISDLVRHALAAAVVLFYSRSMLSAMVRAVISL